VWILPLAAYPVLARLTLAVTSPSMTLPLSLWLGTAQSPHPRDPYLRSEAYPLMIPDVPRTSEPRPPAAAVARWARAGRDPLAAGAMTPGQSMSYGGQSSRSPATIVFGTQAQAPGNRCPTTRWLLSCGSRGQTSAHVLGPDSPRCCRRDERCHSTRAARHSPARSRQ